MKKLIYTSFLLIMVLLSSCTKSNDSGTESFDQDLIGTWELISFTSNGDEFIDPSDCFDRIIITSTTIESIEYFDSGSGTGCNPIPGQFDDPIPYTLEDNIISTVQGGEVYSVEIILLIETTLKVQEIYMEGGVTYTDIETYNRVN
jgi:hypothetical protein